MKQKSLLKTMLLLFALIAGSSSVWAATKTEGFETKATSTTYNSTVTIAANESDCSIAWSIYYGTVSTNDKISGSNSAQMRWYSSAKENIPYAKTTTAIDGLTNVALKARTSSTDVKMDVCYSADGSSWTVGKTHTFTETGKGENVSLDIPSGNKYVKFEVSSSSTAPSSGNYKLIVDDVVFTYTSSTEDATWSLDPTSATVMEGQSTNLQLTTNYDGTLNFESEDTDIATVSYNSTTKVITVVGVAEGSTTINVTGAATATYSSISKSISVTVTPEELEYNMTDVMGNFGYSYFGLTPSGSNTYVDLDDNSISKTDAYGVSITFNRNTGNPVPTKLRFDAAYMRFYKGNSLVVTAPAGSKITKIILTEPASGKAWAGSMTANSGKYAEATKTWYATSDVTSVELTNDNTKRVGGLKVYLMATSLPITIATSGYSSLATPVGLDFANATAGLEAYVASAISASGVTLAAVNEAPASTGVILKGTAGATYTIPVKADAAAIAGTNYLKAAVAAYNCAANEVYILKGGKFCKVTAASTVPAGKAYLLAEDVPVAAPELEFNFGGTTAIDAIQKQTKNGEFYNLAGLRVANPSKGLYIVNGKKVVIK